MIPLYRPYMAEQLPELLEIVHSGKLAYGEQGRKFEKALREFIGCTEEVLVVNSFTAAIQVVLATLEIKEGDEIIASPQSCLASTMPLISYGAKVVWADIDPKRGTLCPQSVKSKITPRTKAILHNHHCSYVGYVDEINSIGTEYGITVIDDAIEAFGSEYKGKMLGNLSSDVTILSFQTVRLPNTIDGGAVIFKDKELCARASRVRDLGVDRSTFRDSLGEINPNSDVDIKGYGVTLNDVSSYIGLSQMPHLPKLVATQRENAKKWREEIAQKYPELTPLNTESINPAYWVWGALADNKVGAITHFRARGFYASGVHLPNSYYSVFGEQLPPLKGVEEFYNHFIALPCGWWINNL